MKWILQKKKIDEIKKWIKNPRKISKTQAQHLEESIGKFGLCQPIVVNADGTIIGGHQRYSIMQKLKYKEVDVYISSSQIPEKEASELALRLNKNHGDWDFDILANQFDIDDLLAVGWEYKELGIDDDTTSDNKNIQKRCKLIITFQTVEDLQDAESSIATIVDSYDKSFYKIKY